MVSDPSRPARAHPISCGNENNGAQSGSTLSEAFSLVSNRTGQASPLPRPTSGTHTACMRDCAIFPHFNLSRKPAPSRLASTSVGSLVKSNLPLLGSRRADALAIEKKRTERKVLKTRPKGPLLSALAQRCRSSSTGSAGARGGSFLIVMGSAPEVCKLRVIKGCGGKPLQEMKSPDYRQHICQRFRPPKRTCEKLPKTNKRSHPAGKSRIPKCNANAIKSITCVPGSLSCQAGRPATSVPLHLPATSSCLKKERNPTTLQLINQPEHFSLHSHPVGSL